MDKPIPIQSLQEFKSLYSILYDQPTGLNVSVAKHVAEHGLYFYSHEEKVLHPVHPHSHGALCSLRGVSANLCFKVDPPPSEFIEWYQEDDPCYFYGWPANAVPQFAPEQVFGWVRSFWFFEPMGRIFNEKICTIGKLLAMEKADTASIYRAMDQGFYMLNPVGAVERLTTRDHEFLEIKQGLAAFNQAISSGKTPSPEILGNKVFSTCGWLHEKTPNFAEIAKGEIVELIAKNEGSLSEALVGRSGYTPPTDEGEKQTRQIDKRTKGTYERITCVLLALLRNDMTDRHGNKVRPAKNEFTQKELNELIWQKFPNDKGLKEDNIKKIFRESNLHRSKISLPAINDDD